MNQKYDNSNDGKQQIKLNLNSIIMNSCRRLNHIRRFSSVPVLRAETVSDHMYWVWYYSTILWEFFQQSGYKIDWEKLMKYSLFHDVPEAQTGDILKTTKYYKPELKELIDEAEVNSFELSFQDVTPSIVENLKKFTFKSKEEGLEGRIVALSDLLSVLAYCIEEYNLWNKYMRLIHMEVQKHVAKFNCWEFPLLKDLINEIAYDLDAHMMKIT